MTNKTFPPDLFQEKILKEPEKLNSMICPLCFKENNRMSCVLCLEKNIQSFNSKFQDLQQEISKIILNLQKPKYPKVLDNSQIHSEILKLQSEITKLKSQKRSIKSQLSLEIPTEYSIQVLKSEISTLSSKLKRGQDILVKELFILFNCRIQTFTDSNSKLFINNLCFNPYDNGNFE
jgi:hypothetical protein